MLLVSLVLLAVPDVTVRPPSTPPRRLDPAKISSCLRLAPTTAVPSGQFRVQCDDATRSCLAAPERVLLDGVEGEESLSRVPPCAGTTRDVQRALDERFDFEQAIADTQVGWYRDEQGRVVQVNFDLGRRVWLGGAWAPLERHDTGATLGRARVELGVAISWLGDEDHQEHRLHLLEGTVWLGDPKDARFDMMGLRYDSSLRRTRPPLWVTTFVGRPRRFDLDLNLTWALEVAHFEALGGRSFLNVAQVDAALELWHSADLDSYLRLRAGPGLEIDLTAVRPYFVPTVALEADVVLDRDGFHHLTAQALGEKLVFAPQLDGRAVSPSRLKLRAGYEVVLVALNDYPLTLVTEARAAWRDDVLSLSGWEFQATAGLRFSLWAPARHFATHVP
jgi:hypothetical protein